MVEQDTGRFCGTCGAALAEDDDRELSRASLERIGIATTGRWRWLGAVGLAIAIGMIVMVVWPTGDGTRSTTVAVKSRAMRIGMPSIVRVEAASLREEVAAVAPPRRPRPQTGRASPAPPIPARPPTPAPAPARARDPEPEPEPARAREPERELEAMPMPGPSAAAVAYLANARSAVVRDYQADFQRCFDAASRNDPSVSGSVRVGFVLDAEGRVLSSRVVSNTTGQDTIGTCITSSARRWQLPRPPNRALEMFMSFRL